ncbi:MAG: PAS domain S-box protein [Acidobacteria bacterium]|nr:PAS domain S-box protein [Acidobacteriota bacterium]
MKRRGNYALNKSAARLLVWAVLAFSIISHAAPAESNVSEQKQILILSHIKKDSPFQNYVGGILKKAITDHYTGRIDFYEEFVDSNRFTDPTLFSALHDFLLQKYQGKRLDMIIPIGGAAVDLIGRYGDEIFPGAQVVYLGGSREIPEESRARINSTGVITSLNFKNTIDLALQLQPDVSQVVVVNDESEFGKDFLKLFRHHIRELEGRLTFAYLNGMRLEEIKKKVANLHRGSIVFYLHYSLDVAGNRYTANETVHQIATAANAPTYTWIDAWMSPEVVGGSLLDINAAAGEVAGMALQVLWGENPRNIQIKEYKSDAIILSSPQLKRWGISENKLPRGSRIIYREPTFWQQYQYYVIATLSILAAQSLLIGLLLLERQRRRRVTQGLRKSEEQFRLLFENSKDAILITDDEGDLIQTNHAACALLGYPKEHLMGMSISGVMSAISPGAEFDIQSYRERGYLIGELSFVRPDGEHRTSEYTACRLAPGLHLGILRDVTDRKRAEDEIRLSEERFSKAFRASPDVIIIIRQADRRIIDINDSCERVFGISRGEIIGRTPAELDPYVNGNDGQRLPHLIDKWGLLHNVEAVLQTKSGQVRQTSISSETIVISGEPCFITIIHDITERKKAEDALRELTARLLKLQDEERRRIARELHDVTAQNLFAIHSQLSLLVQGRYQPSQLNKKLIDCHTLVKESLKEIRTFSYLLHPPMLEHAGLKDTLQWYVDGFIKRSDIRVDLDVSEDIDRLPPDIEIAFFRIVQESLANIHRHSGSSTASISLEKQAGQLVLRIKDAGHGLPPRGRPQESAESFLLGVGIPGMRERMRQLGGSLEIESISEGTTVTATVPLIGVSEVCHDSYSVGR